MALSSELVGISTMRGRRKFRGLRVNAISAATGAAVTMTTLLKLSMTSLMDVLETGTPAKVRVARVFVRAAACESSVHCGAGKESAIASSALFFSFRFTK